MKLQAYYNHGRWVVDCLNCSGSELAVPGTQFVCGNEYPETRSRNPVKRATAMQVPIALGRVYDVEFPAEKNEIEAVLARRPRIENRNWKPGETIDDLLAENKEHGIK